MSEETQAERVTAGLESIDRLIHEPGRLAIMARLDVVEEADWLFLHHQTGLSFGNLASHLTRLEAAGYVESEKTFIDRKPHTVVRITDSGRQAFMKYRVAIKTVIDTREPGESHEEGY